MLTFELKRTSIHLPYVFKYKWYKNKILQSKKDQNCQILYKMT